MNTVYLKRAVTADFLPAVLYPFYIGFKLLKRFGFYHRRVAGEKKRGKMSKNVENGSLRPDICSQRYHRQVASRQVDTSPPQCQEVASQGRGEGGGLKIDSEKFSKFQKSIFPKRPPGRLPEVSVPSPASVVPLGPLCGPLLPLAPHKAKGG